MAAQKGELDFLLNNTGSHIITRNEVNQKIRHLKTNWLFFCDLFFLPIWIFETILILKRHMLPDQSTSFLDFKFTCRSKNKTTWGLPNRNDYIAICIISFQILFEFFLKVSPYIYESECEEFGFFLDRYTMIIIFLF